MDRLSAVIAFVLAGCAGDGGESKPAPPSRSRVNAVAAKKPEAPAPVDLATFCDQRHDGDAAPELTWPELREPPGAGKGPRWINVWATWCAPCVAELPRLAQWKSELGKQVDFDLVFVSGDGDHAAVEAFAQKHPEVSGTLELADAAALAPWLEGMGLRGSLPVHLFVDAGGRVRCARMSEIGDDDREAVAHVLAALQ